MKKEQSNKYDVVVGIPSYNESDTISHVTKTVGEGLEKFFSDKKSIIVNVDNNSPDNTKEAFLDTKTRIEKKYISTSHGVRGKGNNFYNLFKFAKSAGAEAPPRLEVRRGRGAGGSTRVAGRPDHEPGCVPGICGRDHSGGSGGVVRRLCCVPLPRGAGSMDEAAYRYSCRRL